jgi:hypothetical protein
LNANFYRITHQLNVTPREAEQFVTEVNGCLPDGTTYTAILQALRQLPETHWKPEIVVASLAGSHCPTPTVGVNRLVPVEVPQSSKPIVTVPQAAPTVTEVVGFTYDGRLSVVHKLSVGERIILRREPQNAYDRNAIMVLRQTGEKFGYINRFLARSLASRFDTCGQEVSGSVRHLSKTG